MSCAKNAYGGINIILPILRSLKDTDIDTYQRIQKFYSELNHDNDGTLVERCSSLIFLDLCFQPGLNQSTVIAEIKAIEQNEPTQTKNATIFKGFYLSGLYHKHYMNGDIPSLAKNVKNALKEYGIPFVDQKIKASQAEKEMQFFTKKDMMKIAEDVVTNNLAKRRKEHKITGEWIIYAHHEGKNFYLCLAKHDDGDIEIQKKLKTPAYMNSPF